MQALQKIRSWLRIGRRTLGSGNGSKPKICFQFDQASTAPHAQKPRWVHHKYEFCGGEFLGTPAKLIMPASKAGVIGFSKSIAKEVGSRNIRCNVIAPGFIETEMTDSLTEDVKASYIAGIPLKALGKGEDVANACVYLGSDMSRLCDRTSTQCLWRAECLN